MPDLMYIRYWFHWSFLAWKAEKHVYISPNDHLWVRCYLLCLTDLIDTITGPNEELFTPVWGSPVTPPGIIEEAPSLFPALPDSETSSESGTAVPSISHVNTAASYGLDQLESEGTHALKGVFSWTDWWSHWVNVVFEKRLRSNVFHLQCGSGVNKPWPGQIGPAIYMTCKLRMIFTFSNDWGKKIRRRVIFCDM